MKKKRIIMIIGLLSLSILVISSTYAFWRIESSSINILTTGTLKGKIIETYDPPESVYPGGVVDKIVNVKNTGTSDGIVRVAITKQWGSEKEGQMIANTLPTENIEIKYDTENWIDGKDGYHYYKTVIKAKEESKTPLFKEFSLDKKSGNEYAGMRADIAVHMEMIQANVEALGTWNKDIEIEGLHEKGLEKNAQVHFQNPVEGFSFEPERDLFINFKELLPQETRSQKITIDNQYEKAIEISIKAEETKQEYTSAEEREKIEDLLKKHAYITIRKEDGTQLYRGAVWGNLDSEKESMKEEISLGRFEPGKKQDLQINLSLAKEANENDTALLGKVKWTFSAQEGSGEQVDTITPDTSDKTEIKYFIVPIVSLCSMIMLFVYKKKQNKQISETKC